MSVMCQRHFLHLDPFCNLKNKNTQRWGEKTWRETNMQLFLIESAQSGNPTALCSGPDQRPLVVPSEERHELSRQPRKTLSIFVLKRYCSPEIYPCLAIAAIFSEKTNGNSSLLWCLGFSFFITLQLGWNDRVCLVKNNCQVYKLKINVLLSA